MIQIAHANSLDLVSHCKDLFYHKKILGKYVIFLILCLSHKWISIQLCLV